MNEQLEQRGNLDYYLYVLIAIFPILALYKFLPLVSLGYAALFYVLLRTFITNQLSVRYNTFLMVTMSALVVMNLIIGTIRYADITNTVNNTASMILFTVLAVFLCRVDYLDEEELYRACKFVGIFATLFLLYQFASYYLLGAVIHGQIPFLALMGETGFRSIEWGRPTSFFYEPAHYAIYIAPIYATALVKKEYTLSSLLLLGLLFSTSSTGLIIAFLVPVLVALTSKQKTYTRNVVTLLIGFLTVTTIINNFYDRFGAKIAINGLMSDIRVFGSTEYFRLFDDQELVFGIGLNRLAEFLLLHGYSTASNYANAYFFAIFSFGIVGASIWVVYNVTLYFGLRKEYRSLFYVFILISFSDQLLFGRNLLYLLIWIYAFSKNGLMIGSGHHGYIRQYSNDYEC